MEKGLLEQSLYIYTHMYKIIKYIYIYSFIYLWLHWVFVAVCELSLRGFVWSMQELIHQGF